MKKTFKFIKLFAGFTLVGLVDLLLMRVLGSLGIVISVSLTLALWYTSLKADKAEKKYNDEYNCKNCDGICQD